MKTISLGNDRYTIVDDADFFFLSQWRWYYNKHYAFRMDANTMVYMHRLIMGNPKGYEVDHINNDKLDNRRENLRLVTRSVNEQNKPSPNGTSKFKGVHWAGKARKWRAGIKVNYRMIHLPYFESEEDAARAYDRAARLYFGELAYQNFPNESEAA